MAFSFYMTLKMELASLRGAGSVSHTLNISFTRAVLSSSNPNCLPPVEVPCHDDKSQINDNQHSRSSHLPDKGSRPPHLALRCQEGPGDGFKSHIQNQKVASSRLELFDVGPYPTLV